MMFYMTSKVFQDIFLNNEKDEDILEAQYVLSTSKIRKRNMKKWPNIISAYNILFPDSKVCLAYTDDEVRSRYFDQLAENEGFLATLIKGSIKDDFNIIFLTTHKERKLKYMKYLSEYIYIEFGYPVYEYSKYASGASPLLKYDKNKVLKKCNHILENAKKNDFMKKVNNSSGRKAIMDEYKKMPKKKLIKILKKRGLYTPGMDKEDILETLETFLGNEI